VTDDTASRRDHENKVLVPLLLAMTVATGSVDAVSILRLGHVFVANMTGNVVFLGFAFARAPGFSIPASAVALAAFLVGAGIGPRVTRSTVDRIPLLTRVAAAEAALFAAATVVAASASGTAARYSMLVLLALAMGGQNAAARRLAVPDLTTTVLTLTLTGLVADKPRLGGLESPTTRRLGAVAAMLAGAVGGALLALRVSTAAALAAATALLMTVAAVAVTRPTAAAT
jgi:uncharacterized membrane protein YoaK (UPF0700 family)